MGSSLKDLFTLPDDLPVPVDDGACSHLLGMTVPVVPLPATSGEAVDLGASRGTVIAYFYPMLGSPDAPPLVGWNEIPGARGCTPQACGFRDHHEALKAFGAQVFGVSAQPLAEQREAQARLHLPFDLLNDEDLALASALRLPTFSYAGKTLIKRLTLIIGDGVIEKVFYPVFPPDAHAAALVGWFSSRADEQ